MKSLLPKFTQRKYTIPFENSETFTGLATNIQHLNGIDNLLLVADISMCKLEKILLRSRNKKAWSWLFLKRILKAILAVS